MLIQKGISAHIISFFMLYVNRFQVKTEKLVYLLQKNKKTIDIALNIVL